MKTITERLVTAFFGDAIDAKVKEQIKMQAASASESLEEEGYRKLTGDSTRTLPGMNQDRMIQIAYWLWKTNPLGNWIIEIMTGFVVGEGFRIEAEDETVKEILNKFWDHPLNNLNIYLEKHVRELGIYGEQCWPKFVGDYTGTVALGYVDPANIKTVVTDPENCKMVIGVVTRGVNFTDGRKYKAVLHPDAEEFLSPSARSWRDNCQYACYFSAINNVTNDPRGTSDLFVVADWLDAYEQFLFDYADKWPMLNTFVWDMLVEGGSPATIAEQVKTFTKKSGSVFGHNEKVKVTPSTPDLKSIDAAAGAQLFRNHILGNKSLPEHWYGGGGDVNRATAAEMGTPTMKMLSSRQKLVIFIVCSVLDDVLREAETHGMLKGVAEDKRGYKLITPELASKDITKFSAAIQALTTSLVSAEVNGWIDRDNAVKIWAFCLSMIGYELDVDAISENLDDEEIKKAYEDYLKKEKGREA